MVLGYKGVTEVKVESPAALGGLKSEAYKAVSPHCKMPTLVCPDGRAIVESDTIARFLGGKFSGTGRGDFAPPAGTDLAVRVDAICRHHDVYMAPLQGCLYKESPRGQGFSVWGTRDAAVKELLRQIAALEDLIVVDDDDPAEGPYLCGAEPTQADCAVYPTLLFAEYMLPKFGETFELEPKLARWWQFMNAEDDVAKRIRADILAAFDAWEARDRWGGILGAGLRDDPTDITIFDKIIAKEIPADIVYEDDLCLAFRDINPAAPVHVLLIPKKRATLTQLQFAKDDHIFILGYLMSKVGAIARDQGLDSYRVVVNDGAEASQSVFHLHLHILGGRDMAWPPG